MGLRVDVNPNRWAYSNRKTKNHVVKLMARLAQGGTEMQVLSSLVSRDWAYDDSGDRL
jgi:hypothetical protein